MFKKKSVFGVRPLLRSGNICVLEKPSFFQFPAKCNTRSFFHGPTNADTRRCKSRFFFATQPRRRRPVDAKVGFFSRHNPGGGDPPMQNLTFWLHTQLFAPKSYLMFRNGTQLLGGKSYLCIVASAGLTLARKMSIVEPRTLL